MFSGGKGCYTSASAFTLTENTVYAVAIKMYLKAESHGTAILLSKSQVKLCQKFALQLHLFSFSDTVVIHWQLFHPVGQHMHYNTNHRVMILSFQGNILVDFTLICGQNCHYEEVQTQIPVYLDTVTNLSFVTNPQGSFF